jgi:hypothetical protein
MGQVSKVKKPKNKAMNRVKKEETKAKPAPGPT